MTALRAPMPSAAAGVALAPAFAPAAQTEVPFPIAPLPHAMVWCSGRSRDPALTWLRDRLRPIVKRNFES